MRRRSTVHRTISHAIVSCNKLTTGTYERCTAASCVGTGSGLCAESSHRFPSPPRHYAKMLSIQIIRDKNLWTHVASSKTAPVVIMLIKL